MKKRLIALFLLIALCACWGCQEKPAQETMVSPARFYYKPLDGQYGSTQGATDFEYRETAGHEGDYDWIFSLYFAGPQSPELAAPFQKSTELVSAEFSGTQLRLVVSENLADLSGVDLTMACACITLTGLALPGVETVSIRAQGHALDGKREIVMGQDDLLLEDLGASLVSASYTLYFSDTDNRYLIGETIQVDLEQENLPAYLVGRLLSGPSESGLAETMPLGTSLIGLEITDGICHVDLSSEFLEHAPRTALAQRMTILSLTNTLTQLEEINSVVLYADSELLTQYGDMNLSQPLTYEERAIGPVRTALSETDADLHLFIGNGQALFRLPVRVRQTASQATTELVLQALLSYTDQNGYHTAIPAGTTLLSVHQEDGMCTVDLSQEFLSASEELTLAVRSVLATALAAGECSLVRITVNGDIPQGAYGTLFGWHQRAEDFLTD